LLTAIVAVVTVLYVVFLGVMFFLNTLTPIAGIVAERNSTGQWVVTRVIPPDTAFEQNIQIGAVVRSVDGIPASQLVIAGQTDFGGAKEIVIEPGGPANTLAPPEDGNPLFRWTYSLLGLIFIAVGGPVFVKARQRKAAIAFYAICVSTALCFASAIGVTSQLQWSVVVVFVSLVLFAGSFVLFFLEFPVPVGKVRARHNVLVGLVIAGALTMFAMYVYMLVGDAYFYNILRSLLFLYLAGCVLAGVTCILRSFVAERSRDVRQQLVILLGGTAIAVAPACFLTVIPVLLGLPSVGMEFSAIPLGVMPLAFAYAITQHQLLGVRHFVRRGVVYLIMGSSVLLVFSLSASALGSIMPNGWEKNEAGLIGFGFFVFLIAYFYSRIQVGVEHMVDRFIYHDAYDYKEALLQFSAQLASEQKLQILSDELVERTCRLMNLTCGALLLVVEPDPHGLRNSGPLRGYAGLTTVLLDEPEKYVGADITSGYARVRAQGDGTRPIYLETYAVYGSAARQLVEGLQDELSQLGIGLHGRVGLTQSMRGTMPSSMASFDSVRGLCESNEVRQVTSLSDAVNDTQVTEILKPHNEDAEASTGKLEMIQSFLGVPLWTRQRFVGVLCLAGKKTGERFTKDDLSLLSTLGSQAALAIYNAQLHEAREAALLDTIAALAHAIEAKDGYTIHHCENMTGRAVALAQTLGLTRQEIENVRMGAILHDIGKIGIPDAVLNKPGKLTADEYEIIKEHAAIGARIVQSVGALHDVVPIVLHHQERYDGSGYPDGLRGQNIPVGARIIGVVDTYGAMTEDRIYRRAPGHARAIAEIERLAGKQFDPIVVAAFLQLLKEQPELVEPEPEPAETEPAFT
jgi:putative nucleotidyltransferase with HDIG domain